MGQNKWKNLYQKNIAKKPISGIEWDSLWEVKRSKDWIKNEKIEILE